MAKVKRKETRLTIYLSYAEKALIESGALKAKRSASDFCVQVSCERAQQIGGTPTAVTNPTIPRSNGREW